MIFPERGLPFIRRSCSDRINALFGLCSVLQMLVPSLVVRKFLLLPYFSSPKADISPGINIFSKFIRRLQVGCLVYLRFTVRIPASACKHHPPVPESDIIYHCKLIIGNRLLKCPKEIVSRSHEQCTVPNRIFFISAKRRVGIFLCDTVKPFNESLYPGGYRPEIQRRGKDDTVRSFYFGKDTP